MGGGGSLRSNGNLSTFLLLIWSGVTATWDKVSSYLKKQFLDLLVQGIERTSDSWRKYFLVPERCYRREPLTSYPSPTWGHGARQEVGPEVSRTHAG